MDIVYYFENILDRRHWRSIISGNISCKVAAKSGKVRKNEKISERFKKFGIIILLMRSFIITISCNLLILFQKKFAFAILYFQGLVFGININLLWSLVCIYYVVRYKCFAYRAIYINRVATWSGKVRKSGKIKKNDKSQEKMGCFEKKSGKVRKFDKVKKKKSDFVSLNLQNSLFSKAFKW